MAVPHVPFYFLLYICFHKGGENKHFSVQHTHWILFIFPSFKSAFQLFSVFDSIQIRKCSLFHAEISAALISAVEGLGKSEICNQFRATAVQVVLFCTRWGRWKGDRVPSLFRWRSFSCMCPQLFSRVLLFRGSEGGVSEVNIHCDDQLSNWDTEWFTIIVCLIV